MQINKEIKECECVACEACVQICPKKCINMQENKRGFLIPKIDKEKCVNCGLCKKVCPYNNEKILYDVKDSYAAITNDKDVIKRSTSGGIFFHFAKKIIEMNGIVCGCVWNENGEAIHAMIDNIDGINRLSQSKYVQSRILNTYQETKQSLENGKAVLYSGTACQIAGLYSFLNKEYEELYTIEVACHGVPAPGMFKVYKEWLENQEHAKIKEFTFRNKEKYKSGEHYMFKVKYSNNVKKYYFANKDPYYDSFLSEKILRETCYDCKFKGIKRISDITLSDFWGIEKENKKFPAYDGASAIMINTIKGKKLFNIIRDELYYKKTNYEAIYKYNLSLIQSANEKNKIEYCIEDIKLFEKIKPKNSIKKIVKNILPSKIKYYLKRVK